MRINDSLLKMTSKNHDIRLLLWGVRTTDLQNNQQEELYFDVYNYMHELSNMIFLC